MSDATTTRPRLDLRSGSQRVFAHVLVSSLVVSVANFTVWFAVTFWTYLETRSVFATGLIAGIFLVATASTGIWFGSIVDHHHKKSVLQASAATSLAIYLVCLAGYLLTPSGVSFLVTSVISGLLVAAAGMRYALLLAVVVLAGSLAHLARVHIPERRVI